MVQEKSLIKWGPLAIGVALILAIYVTLATANQGGQNSLFGFLLGGIGLGFLIEAKLKEILINGVILGIVAGLISITILLIQLVTSSLITGVEISGLIILVLILLFYDVIAALVGSILGNFVRAEYKKS
ncbi:MAG TPA: hypothetical protein VGC02_03025 [Methanobacterium sp.]